MGLHSIALIAETNFWFRGESWLAMFMVAAGLGFVIFVHELGHFLVAKFNGVKCEKFYLGFDVPFGKLLGALLQMDRELTIFGLPIPKTLGKFQWGETEYGIGIIPLGGYVKMLGQDDNPANAQQERERSMIKKETPDDASGDEPQPAEVVADDESYELDPRSYQAKRVYQRMLIISAGVIMNLLTAPIFATVAYKLGVKYVPCEVAAAVPGGPAWRADIRPGDKILQIGGHDSPYEHIRFGWDLRQGVGMAGAGTPVEFLVRRLDGSEDVITITPRTTYYKKGKVLGPTIGVFGPRATRLDAKHPVLEDSLADQVKQKFEKRDRLAAIVLPDGTRQEIPENDYLQVQRTLIKHADQELTFVVERTNGEGDEAKTTTHDIALPPNKLRGLGMVMKFGGIAGIRPGSPAEKAGFKEDDKIKKVAGQSFGGDGIDPMLLPNVLRAHYGQPVDFEVDRKGETVKLEVVPEVPTYFGSERQFGELLAAESIGIVYPILFKVDHVVAGSPADNAGLEPGDEVTTFRVVPREDDDPEDVLNKGEPLEFDKLSHNWVYVSALIQVRPENALELEFTRGGKKQKAVKLMPVELEQFNPERGLNFASKSNIQTAESWTEAAALGLRETKENAWRVVIFLQKLVTGAISPTSLGGPGTIAVVATSEATEGPSRLLLFLTFLSVNLAIVNFLPIPVLDGGHMMFLMYEGVRGKPADEKWLTGLTLAGFFFVIGLMLFVIGLDVFRFSGWGA